MWTRCSTTTCPTRTSITSTASAAPAGPSRHGVAYTLVSTITEGIRLDDIRKNTGNEIRAVRFNEAGELEEVGGNG